MVRQQRRCGHKTVVMTSSLNDVKWFITETAGSKSHRAVYKEQRQAMIQKEKPSQYERLREPPSRDDAGGREGVNYFQ